MAQNTPSQRTTAPQSGQATARKAVTRESRVAWHLAAALFLAAIASGCGGNSTTIGVTVLAAGQGALGSSPTSPVKVFKGATETFSASVTGGSATTVYWQICLPVAVTNPLTRPTSCTPIPGVTTSNASSSVTGYGTITQNGVYLAPTTIPQSNSFEVTATSTVDASAFGVAYVEIDSGVRVQLTPTTATIGTGETYTVTADVTGTTNTGVTWAVNGISGGDTTPDGTIVPTGPQTALYTAPAAATTAKITATSAADSSQSADATITVSLAADPKLSSLDPTTTEQGAAQQDVYLSGSDFFSTSQILLNGAPIPTTWISDTLMRATVPSGSLAQAASLPIQVQQQNGDLSTCTAVSGCSLAVTAIRPTVVASSPDSVISTPAGFGVALTGGFFSQSATTATFDGFPGSAAGVGLATTLANSRQMTANIPAGSLSTPGLYPIFLQNSGLAAGAPATAAVNVAVTPAAGSLVTSPVATISVGSGPTAIAVDEADGLAVVANTGANSASIINLATNAVQTVSVGTAPTGVAVDDGLSGLPTPLHNIAVVVNSGDDTVSAIDLVTGTVTATVPLPALPPPQPSQPSPQAYSIGINPVTHRAIVAIASTDVATILDLSSGAPVVLQNIGGTPIQTAPTYGTGPQPAIAIDPRLNWAVVTSGAGGTSLVNFVDLGNDAAGTAPARAPNPFGDLAMTSSVQGVGLNPETHQVLLTTPTLGNFTTFSLLDQTVSTIAFTNQNVTVDEPGYVAAAVSPLPNIGVAVNSNGNTAAVLDLEHRLVIENVTVGNNPVAVAIDPVTNEALVVNQADGTVSVLSLGTVRSSASLGSSQAPQITLSSPEIAYTSTSPLSLTVNGGGFLAGAQVFLDGTAVPSVLSASGRQIVATVPASMEATPRRYSVYVQNPGQPVISNVEDLVVVQAVPVGSQPFGVAIDTDCDVAAVTNSGDNTVSLVALSANAAPPGKTCIGTGGIGTVGSPIPVGTTPQGIAVDPILGLGVVANSGSENASVIDLTETNPPFTVALCGGGCTGVTGVGMNLDLSNAYVTDVASTAGSSVGSLSTVSLPGSGLPSGATASGSFVLDPDPEAVAADPYIDFLGVTIAGQSTQSSTVDLLNVLQGTQESRPSGFNLPTGIVFDPVNQVFVVANSLGNNIAFVDPGTANTSFAQVGMNPTALDYDYQTSTLVTANNLSKTLSILDYVCPPGIVANCSQPQVRQILGLGASPQFSIAIDPKLNLAVLTDEDNNRVLLIPLP